MRRLVRTPKNTARNSNASKAGSVLLTAPLIAGLLGACGRYPAPQVVPESPQPETSLCGDVSEINLNNRRIVLNFNERLILSDEYLLEYVGANQNGNALFKILNREDNSLVTEFEAERDKNYEIRLGDEVLLVFAACSVNASTDFGERSVTMATDRELDRYVKPEEPSVDAGVADAETPAMCAPVEEPSCIEAPLVERSWTVMDTQTGRDYTITATVEESSTDITYTITIRDAGTDIEDDYGLPREAQHHKVTFWFMNEPYTLSFLTDSSVALFRSITDALLNTGDHVEFGCYRIRLDEVASNGDAHISILDNQNNVLRPNVPISPGTMAHIPIPDSEDMIIIRMWQTSPGYTFGSIWADLSVAANVFHLRNFGTPYTTNGVSHEWTGWQAFITTNERGELTAISLTAPIGTPVPCY